MTLDRHAIAARLRDEHHAWATDLGHALADAATRRLEDIAPHVLTSVSPEIVVADLLRELAKDPTVTGALRRAHRWAIAYHEARTPHHKDT
jgi:hypothetical protein